MNGKAWCIGSTITMRSRSLKGIERRTDIRFAMKLRWVSITPFMPPDVPDVKTTDARSSGPNDGSGELAPALGRCRTADVLDGHSRARARTGEAARDIRARSCGIRRWSTTVCTAASRSSNRDSAFVETNASLASVRSTISRFRPASGRSRWARRRRPPRRWRSRRTPNRCCSHRSARPGRPARGRARQSGSEFSTSACRRRRARCDATGGRVFCWNATLVAPGASVVFEQVDEGERRSVALREALRAHRTRPGRPACGACSVPCGCVSPGPRGPRPSGWRYRDYANCRWMRGILRTV